MDPLWEQYRLTRSDGEAWRRAWHANVIDCFRAAFIGYVREKSGHEDWADEVGRVIGLTRHTIRRHQRGAQRGGLALQNILLYLAIGGVDLTEALPAPADALELALLSTLRAVRERLGWEGGPPLSERQARLLGHLLAERPWRSLDSWPAVLRVVGAVVDHYQGKSYPFCGFASFDELRRVVARHLIPYILIDGKRFLWGC